MLFEILYFKIVYLKLTFISYCLQNHINGTKFIQFETIIIL